jgi:outer membrane protein TolC
MYSFASAHSGQSSIFRWVISVIGVVWVSSAGGADLLTLEETLQLGLRDQPQLQAPQAAALAAENQAQAAGRLPDPRLSVGVESLPISGADAFRLSSEPMAHVKLGVMQEFPRARTRRLQAQAAGHEAAAAQAMVAQARAELQREVSLAWLEIFAIEQAQRLAEAQRQVLEQTAELAGIDYRAGRGSQADVLAARVAAETSADKLAQLRLAGRQARSRLSRWVGDAALRPWPQELPALPDVPTLEGALELAAEHHHIDALARELEAADSAVELAKDDYRPAWGLELYYADRPEFPDMIGARVDIGLPLFTRHRQDRRLAASRARREAVRAKQEDALRMQNAEVQELWAEHQEQTLRLQRFDARILPLARERVAAAEAAYGTGQGGLSAVYQARSALLDSEALRVELAVAQARTLVRFHYFAS